MRSITLKLISGTALATAVVFGVAIDASGQAERRSRTARPTPTPVAEPAIISRAEDWPDENAIPARPVMLENGSQRSPAAAAADAEAKKTIEALQERIRQLEAAAGKSDPDAKQRRMLLNLDILTRAEQRVESLRKQLYDLVEKETSMQARLESISIEARPEMVERSVAFAGTLRPEELREARAKQLSAERNKLQTLLVEIQRNKSTIEASIAKAEDLVERLRARTERDIDEALKDDDGTSQDQ